MVFKYKSICRPDGNQIKTPSIPVTFIGRFQMKIEFMALIDSGADLSVIPEDVAELLDINLEKKRDKSRGIGGEVEVVNSSVEINIKKGHESYTFAIPVQVIIGKQKVPVILGREKFFDEFKITFEQDSERLSLKKVGIAAY